MTESERTVSIKPQTAIVYHTYVNAPSHRNFQTSKSFGKYLREVCWRHSTKQEEENYNFASSVFLSLKNFVRTIKLNVNGFEMIPFII